jgi:hypothetical protein
VLCCRRAYPVSRPMGYTATFSHTHYHATKRLSPSMMGKMVPAWCLACGDVVRQDQWTDTVEDRSNIHVRGGGSRWCPRRAHCNFLRYISGTGLALTTVSFLLSLYALSSSTFLLLSSSNLILRFPSSRLDIPLLLPEATGNTG